MGGLDVIEDRVVETGSLMLWTDQMDRGAVAPG
jgi:hypothetical protein